MEQIAKWTTPSIIYRPSTISPSDIRTAVLCVKQHAKVVIEKDLTTALVEEKQVTWKLTQEETGSLVECKECAIGVDWVLNDGTRGRSNVGTFMVVGSGKDEALAWNEP